MMMPKAVVAFIKGWHFIIAGIGRAVMLESYVRFVHLSQLLMWHFIIAVGDHFFGGCLFAYDGVVAIFDVRLE